VVLQALKELQVIQATMVKEALVVKQELKELQVIQATMV